MSFFKRLFRRPAILLVTAWANRAYRQGVKAAEERRKRERTTVYLAAAAFRPDRLVTYTRETFRVQKRVFGYKARLLTVNTLRQGCYYHTANKHGLEGMPEREREVRRKAFIRERLRLAGLI
ncbi:MAG: hypothetical protein IKW99_03390 [Bacteroidales bacterium]|nr:hypothetical protein [Bacteroidales bacterium]